MQPDRARIRTELVATLALAGPVVLTQLAHISLGFVDTIMVGRLGPDALAGVALGNTLFFTLILVGMGVVMAVGPMVSQAYGAGEWDPIGRSVRQGLWLALGLSIVVSVVYWNAEPILLALGQQPEPAASAAAYLRAIMWGAFPFLGFVAVRSFAEAVSRPRPVTAVAFAGVGLNILANWILMYGKFGAPALGLVGTGWASTIVFWTNFLVLAAFAARDRDFATYRLFHRLGRPDPGYFRQLFRIGWPIGVALGIETTLFMVTLLMMGWIGTTALAAHQVALQCAAFTFMVPLGIGLATSVRVGQAVGRRDEAGIAWAGWTGVGLSTAFMALAATAFLLVPRPIVGLYLALDAPENAQVIPLAVTLLGVAAIFQVADGIQVTAAGALRGLKDTRRPMLIGLGAYWVVGVPTGYLLGFTLDLGPTGLWWGLVLGLAVAAVLLSRRFQRLAHAGPPAADR